MALSPTAPPVQDPATGDRRAALDERIGPALDRWFVERGVKRELRPAARRAAVRHIDELTETQRSE